MDENEEWDEVFVEYETVIDRLGELREVAKDYGANWLRVQAGTELSNLLQDENATKRALDALQPNLRRAAIYLIDAHWQSLPAYLGKIESMALTDSDDLVRTDCLVMIGKHFGGSKDRRTSRFFAQIVDNDEQPERIRLEAYQGLLVTNGKPTVRRAKFRFPSDVDWSFVSLHKTQDIRGTSGDGNLFESGESK
jgi:hypothetical protein